mmetsp:Transcript_37041/g.59986  ORF Transcript_37041/g.59986 Transcript_37041/m.59986 type:complete len:667 (-) Transcript_37041:726-2726(-)|eukprot:CAMPEP_0184663298 /NCGR_PEP_ID=MMETSP0308-20130426/47584_1 /TAXON_ID=38269 /ORGANISM="Gloeochaete witrockiana, Strain SAG 46.84" /LENGTH=666 /DNA_ID=CAMNT_0027105945 /DNA_START=77 /DNA_END=2077 /DNA_ORIENTATION=+
MDSIGLDKATVQKYKTKTKDIMQTAMSYVSDIDKAVVKATNRKLKLPKEKHVRTILLKARSPPEVGLLFKTLAKRLHEKEYLTVLKALIVLHRTMQAGSRAFIEECAANRHYFHLQSYVDKTNAEARDQTLFIRQYGKYLEEWLCVYKASSLRPSESDDYDDDRGSRRESSDVKDVPIKDLFKEVPLLQSQLHTAMSCEPQGSALHNIVSTSGFTLILKDTFRLYALINGSILRLLDAYFDMDKKDAHLVLDIYKQFAADTDKLIRFYEAAKSSGAIESRSIPDVKPVSADFMQTLEDYLGHQEGSIDKGVSKSSGKSRSSNAGSVPAAVVEEQSLVSWDEPPPMASKQTQPEGDAFDFFGNGASPAVSVAASQSRQAPGPLPQSSATDLFNPFDEPVASNNNNTSYQAPSALAASSNPFGSDGFSPPPPAQASSFAQQSSFTQQQSSFAQPFVQQQNSFAPQSSFAQTNSFAQPNAFAPQNNSFAPQTNSFAQQNAFAQPNASFAGGNPFGGGSGSPAPGLSFPSVAPSQPNTSFAPFGSPSSAVFPSSAPDPFAAAVANPFDSPSQSFRMMQQGPSAMQSGSPYPNQQPTFQSMQQQQQSMQPRMQSSMPTSSPVFASPSPIMGSTTMASGSSTKLGTNANDGGLGALVQMMATNSVQFSGKKT